MAVTRRIDIGTPDTLLRYHLIRKVTAQEVWQQLRATNRVGVTRGTLESRRDPLAII